MEQRETECCTPNGQIKRYKDCIGCDKKPLELNQNKMKQKEKEYNRFRQVCMIKNNEKQKAEELVWKFGKGINKLEMTYLQAKECALMAVDEIINASPSLPILGDNGTYGEDIKLSTNYWEEVKQKIINL